jgi:hypothetical protein
VHRKEQGWSMRLVYNPKRLPGVTTARPRVAGVFINGIKADPRGFMGPYGSVEKDTVTYGSGTWVRTHDAWVFWEEHGTVRVC